MKVSVVPVGDLDAGYILSPQRYEPNGFDQESGTPLREIVELVRETISPAKAAKLDDALIIDTSHARNGLLDADQAFADNQRAGSTKKLAQSGDVLISRLRPYLRQVALVDEGAARGALVCGSTEFYVLRSVDERSIAFLVAWLLSEEVQEILASSQEGGHHPRFNAEVLLRLRVPDRVLVRREELSEMVEAASRAYRACRGLLRDANQLMTHHQ